MKVGDLVKCPQDNYYWWGGKVGLVVEIEIEPRPPFGSRACTVSSRTTVRLLIGDGSYTRFGANFLEVISESR